MRLLDCRVKARGMRLLGCRVRARGQGYQIVESDPGDEATRL